MFQKKTNNAVRALAELGEALMTGEESLFTKTADAIAPLGVEAQKLHAESKTLSEAAQQLRPIVEAKVRVLMRQVDDALIRGDQDEAASLRAQAKNLEDQLQATVQNAESCEARAIQLERQIKGTGLKVYAQFYPSIRLATVEICRAVVNLFDTVQDGLVRHAAENGYAVKHMDLINLTPYENGPERTIFLALLRWFGGRTQ